MFDEARSRRVDMCDLLVLFASRPEGATDVGVDSEQGLGLARRRNDSLMDFSPYLSSISLPNSLTPVLFFRSKQNSFLHLLE